MNLTRKASKNGFRPTLWQRVKARVADVAAGAVLVLGSVGVAGCGGTVQTRQDFLIIHMDAADVEDYEEAATYRHAYVAEPMGYLLATDNPSATYARLVLIDWIGTEALSVRVLR